MVRLPHLALLARRLASARHLAPALHTAPTGRPLGAAGREATGQSEALARLGNISPQPITIENLLRKETTSVGYLKHEVPIRLANMIMELQLLPEQLLRQENAQTILEDYTTSFDEMARFQALEEPLTAEQLDSFCNTLNNIRRRHLDTVMTMAEGVVRMNQEGVTEGVASSVAYFLDRLYANRISLHMLMSQFNILQVGHVPWYAMP